jgi:hypothetical protein
MKTKLILLSAFATMLTFASCSGNQSQKNPPDTANSTISQPKSVDTSKTTTTTGDVPNVDNSGNGGTKIDTPKK